DAKSAEQRSVILARAAAIYCVSDYIRNRFLEGVRGDVAKVHVLYNGIDRPAAVPESSGKENTLLFVGRIIPEKGALEFVEAVRPVVERHEGWRVIMVGAKKPGLKNETDYERQVMQSFAALGDRGEFKGYQTYDKVVELFRRASIAVVPSLWPEPFGRTAAEALAYGCALVCTDKGGLPEIADGRGLIVKEPTSQALGGAVLRLVEDDALRLEFQKRAAADFPFDIRALTAQQDDIRSAILEHEEAAGPDCGR
ncbi:MAG TPA: glycosyltransferase family 4 protein, partial [Alphaproteobacteria bacterium]|nr:glycosyltransferase family 4 protein [Alphaproteobacteria bacterium]